MLRYIQRLFLFVYYFFYNLLKGKEEWKCDNDAEKKPTKACCTPVHTATTTENNHHHNLNLKENNKNFLSTPRPYVDPSKKSWWQWTKDSLSNGWQKLKNAFDFRNTRYSSTIAKWIKFIPSQLWRGIKWISHLILSGLLWLLQAFMQIFRSKEASEEQEIPKQYVYKKIESPRDYLNYENDVNYYPESVPVFEEDEEEKDERKKEENENLKNDAKDEITLDNIQKAPEEAIISPPQASALSHGQFTAAPESHANQESPISFYARRVSLTTSKSGGEMPAKMTSPPPPAPPPPPKSAIRIPATAAPINTESKKESNEKPSEAIKGGVSVIVPGLMDAAKESIERRRRGRTLSPENKNMIINSGPTPYRSPSVLGTTTATSSVNNNRVNTTTSAAAATNHVVTRMNAQTPTSEAFLFRPRSQTSKNFEATQKSEDFFHPDRYQSQQRMLSTSPTPSGTFLLGQSVFKPVNEVEKIRDNFNRKCESRGASVVGGGYSRSPSVMSQSYHESARDRDSYTPYRDYESSALRQRFPSQTPAAPSSHDYLSNSYGQTAASNHRWNLRNNNGPNDDVFNRLPTGGTRRVLERKVTEKHLEKDVDGQVLRGWREQNWLGTFETFENPNPIL